MRRTTCEDIRLTCQSAAVVVLVTLSGLAAGCADSAAPTGPAAGALRANAAPLDVPQVVASGLSSGLCVAVAGANTTTSANLIIQTCSDADASQRLTFGADGELRVNGTLCADAAGGLGNDGDYVITYACHGGANQRWALTSAGQIVGVNGKCLDVPGADQTPGTSLIIYTCNGAANQRWDPRAPGTADIGSAAELPRTFLDTRMPAVTGHTYHVPVGGDLQAYLDSAAYGDEVVLPAGATYAGNYVLQAKGGATSTGWIVVRSSGAIPGEGTRVGPGTAGEMATISGATTDPTIAVAPGAQGWRLTGLEITASAQLPLSYVLVAVGTNGPLQDSPAEVPGRVVIDRSYVHGHPNFTLQRCIALHSASSAVIDSYLAECHSNDADSQGIVSWNGPGPFKIVNNRIEAGTQQIMFGGEDPAVQGLIPSDIEIRRNYITRPTSWNGVWRVKNLLELKAGQRVLVEGNVFENNWADAQNGFAFVWWSINAYGGAPWSVTQDVTFRYNRVRNVAAGFNLVDKGEFPSPVMRRVTIAHNVITGIYFENGTGGRLYQVLGDVQGMTIARNSGLGVVHSVIFDAQQNPLSDFVFRDNVTGGQYTLFSSGRQGATTLAALGIPAGNVTGNVFALGESGNVPSSNAYAATVADVGFVDYAAGDLRLAPTSPFLTSGTGGTRPGADVEAVMQATQGVAP